MSKKNNLLKHFGSVAKIKTASIKSISRVNGIGLHTAEIIYKKFGILLVTSPIENCPFSVLEAKSYGIPTLSISDGGIREIVKNNKDGIILNLKDLQNVKKSLFKIVKP